MMVKSNNVRKKKLTQLTDEELLEMKASKKNLARLSDIDLLRKRGFIEKSIDMSFNGLLTYVNYTEWPLILESDKKFAIFDRDYNNGLVYANNLNQCLTNGDRIDIYNHLKKYDEVRNFIKRMNKTYIENMEKILRGLSERELRKRAGISEEEFSIPVVRDSER